MVTISHDPTIIVFDFTREFETRVRNSNVDVEVHDEVGRWSATFFTLENVETLMLEHALTGESTGGLYLWATDMILVRELSYDVIRETVAGLRRSGDFPVAFMRLDDD